jgi:hypothetical protein
MVKLSDQYGNAMSLSGVNASVFNQTNGYIYPFTGTDATTLEIDATAGGGEAGDTVYVFVYDPVSQLQVTATILIVDAPVIAGISIEGFIWNTEADIDAETDTVRFTEGDMTALLDIECVDQYGDEYVLTGADLTTGSTPDPEKIQVLVSNTAVLDTVDLTPAGGDLELKGIAPGTAIVTLVLPSESIIEQSEMITVYAAAELDSLTVADPATAVYADEDAELPAWGYDQYGDAADFDGTSGISFTVNNTMVLDTVNIEVTDTNEITFTPHAAGEVTIFVFLGG